MGGIRKLSDADELGLQVKSRVSAQPVQPRVGNKYSFSLVDLDHIPISPPYFHTPLSFPNFVGIICQLHVLLNAELMKPSCLVFVCLFVCFSAPLVLW